METSSSPALFLYSPCLREDGTPAFQPRPLEEVGAELQRALVTPPARPGPSRRIHSSWRLVLPGRVSEGPPREELLLALGPLLRHRKASEPLEFQFREDLPIEDQVLEWEQTHADPLYKENVTLLLAGSLRDLPFVLQRSLCARHAVGRLCFSSAEAYAAYARKVVAAESGSSRDQVREALLFAPSNDEATNLTHDLVIAPLERVLRRKKSGLLLHLLLREQALRSVLLSQLEQAAPRSLLVMGGHGSEPVEWNGNALGLPFDQDKRIIHTGFIQSTSSYLDQGIAVLISCHSAGRTGGDLLSILEGPIPTSVLPERLAPLPNVLLAHARGPLAVLAHVDRLYVIGFADRSTRLTDAEFQPGVFPLHGLLEHLISGEKLGVAMSTFRKTQSRSEAELRRLLEDRFHRSDGRSEGENIRLARTWYRWYNSQSWAVLGDPEVALRGRTRDGM